MPSTTATKTTARQVNVGDMVSKTKTGTFAKVTSLSPGANSVWITFEKGNRIRPGFDTPVWVLAETTETPAPAAEAPEAKPAAEAAPATAAWPTEPAAVFANYLGARTSGAADAPHQGLPFITEKGILRVKPSDWLQYLMVEGFGAPKREALQVLRDQGLVQRVYPLPAVEGQEDLAGKSFGLYTGKATPAMKYLPRRAGAAPAAKPAAGIADKARAADREREADAKARKADASDNGVARVAASALAVGDAIGTTRTDSRKAIEAGEGHTIAAITTSRDGRVQARDAHGKVIRSLAATTQVWAGRDNAPSDAAHQNA